MSGKFRSRLGDDLERLIRSIGDCKSKSEEDRILLRSIEATKALLKTGKTDKSQMRDLMIKLLYFEMLGHDASFGHFMAVQGCGSSSLQTKLVRVMIAICGMNIWNASPFRVHNLERMVTSHSETLAFSHM